MLDINVPQNDRFDLQVILNTILASLPSQTRMFHSTKPNPPQKSAMNLISHHNTQGTAKGNSRRRSIRNNATVDSNHTKL